MWLGEALAASNKSGRVIHPGMKHSVDEKWLRYTFAEHMEVFGFFEEIAEEWMFDNQWQTAP